MQRIKEKKLSQKRKNAIWNKTLILLYKLLFLAALKLVSLCHLKKQSQLNQAHS